MPGWNVSGGVDIGPPGFFGKLPKLGDFVTRRLPNDFVEAWDSWLQQVIAESRQAMGDAWLDAYLICPIWRFVLAPGICGTSGWLGALMASVDRVGRYYPLTAAIALPAAASGLAPLLLSPSVGRAWFEPVENAMLAVLGAQGTDAQNLTDALQSADATPILTLLSEATEIATEDDPAAQRLHWTWPTASPEIIADRVLRTRLRPLEDEFAPMTAWMSCGSDTREGEMIVLRGLPSAALFGTFLTGASVPTAAPHGGIDPLNALPLPVALERPTSLDRIDETTDDTIPQARLAAVAPLPTLQDDVRNELERLLQEPPQR